MILIVACFVGVLSPVIFFLGGYMLGKDRAYREAIRIIESLERAHKNQLEFLAKHFKDVE